MGGTADGAGSCEEAHAVPGLVQAEEFVLERGLLPAPELLEWVAQKPERRRILHPTPFLRMRYSERRL